jgi:FtsZ-interacting cell division protein ZipA
MNELQIALALIGALAVIGILIYNRLQERKFHRQAEAGFARPGRDVLLDADTGNRAQARVEPGFFEPAFDDAEIGLPQRQHDPEPQFTDAGTLEASIPETWGDEVPADEPVAESAPRPAMPTPSGQDEAIEFRAVMKNLEGMASGHFADTVGRSAALGKTVRWLGLPLGSPTWEELVPQDGKRYLEVQAAMQLADRDGAAQKEDLTALCALSQELAQTQGWQLRCDDPAEASGRAQSLDKFCADVDVQIGLNIVARGTAVLPIARIRHEAEAAGMKLAANGAYLLLDSRGEVLFMLGNREPLAFSRDNMDAPETKGVTLLFDVPRVPDGLKNFDGMVTLGRKLAHEAGGLLVDDNLRPLTDVGIEKIRAQLAQIYDRMEARGVPAGSRMALRLFS